MKKVGNSETQIIVGPVRLSYLSVFKPRKNDMKGGAEEYSVTCLIPKEAHKFCPDPKTELKGIAVAIKAALTAKFKEEPKVWSNPLKDGDAEQNNEGEPKYPGYWYINTRSDVEYPPVLITGENIPALGGFESGDWGKVQISCFGFEFQGKKGASAGLRAIQFLYKDEPFGQSTDPVAVAAGFDKVEDAAKGDVEEYDPMKDF